MNQNDQDDLDWLAFRYVADELGEDERLAFEERLADDQAAREAVAKAVELDQLVVAARKLEDVAGPSVFSPAASPARIQRVAWSSPALWMSVGAAACLLLVALVSFAPRLWPQPAPAVANKALDLELAQTWTTVREESKDESSWDELLTRTSDAAGELPNPASGDDPSFEASAIPSWMQSAVAGEAMPEGATEPREN